MNNGGCSIPCLRLARFAAKLRAAVHRVLKIVRRAAVYRGWQELRCPWPRNTSPAGSTSWSFRCFYFFPIFLYCNFFRLLRYRDRGQPLLRREAAENFNRPWLARNVLEFWNRWHITLGTWIRDYLFMPMYKRWWSAGRSGHRALLGSLLPGFSCGRRLARYDGQLSALRRAAGPGCVGGQDMGKSHRCGPAGRTERVHEIGLDTRAAIVANIHFQSFTLLFFALPDCADSWQLLARICAGREWIRELTIQ